MKRMKKKGGKIQLFTEEITVNSKKFVYIRRESGERRVDSACVALKVEEKE